jgi:large subunit ribosomal protein L6
MAEKTAKPTARTSRIGKRPIDVPKGVEVTLDGSKVQVKGPKGTLSRVLPERVSFRREGDIIHVASDAPGRDAPRLQGLARALVASMVKGVAEGYEKRLELHGTGYRAEVSGNKISLSLGFTSPIDFGIPDGLKAETPKEKKGTLLILQSADKELIGQAAATIRGFRPPEPYGGKGVRYQGERIREKAGKAGK